MNAVEINVELLPFILQDLTHLIGLPLTMCIVEKYGGIRLYVPKEALADDHDLVKLLGREAAEKLQSHYGGEMHFDIPLALAHMRAVRNAEIRVKRKNTTASALARDYRTTERNIRLICGEVEDDSQCRLF